MNKNLSPPLRGLGSLSIENEVHPTSIVISVTANVKPSNQHEEDRPWEGHRSYYHMLEEVCISYSLGAVQYGVGVMRKIHHFQ